jgi:hypothetical protein
MAKHYGNSKSGGGRGSAPSSKGCVYKPGNTPGLRKSGGYGGRRKK